MTRIVVYETPKPAAQTSAEIRKPFEDDEDSTEDDSEQDDSKDFHDSDPDLETPVRSTVAAQRLKSVARTGNTTKSINWIIPKRNISHDETGTISNMTNSSSELAVNLDAAVQRDEISQSESGMKSVSVFHPSPLHVDSVADSTSRHFLHLTNFKIGDGTD